MKKKEEKTYLKWYSKIGYGSGDVAGNIVYALLSSFVMIYLTDTVGLNAGIIGTLMALSKLFDGVTDIFFGSLIDRTHTRMGKARPWMFYGYFGCAAALIAVFAVPQSLGEAAQYVWFFISYTLLNAVFYTANNIAYSSLTSLITKNANERVQIGSIRFMFAFGTSLVIQVITVGAVRAMGGGASGWRTAALVYSLIGLAVNTLSVFSVKELPEEEKEEKKQEEKYTFRSAAGLLFRNRYYLLICGIYILTQIFTAMINMGIYFMKYVLGSEDYFALFSAALNIPQIIGLVFTPILIRRAGNMIKVNTKGYAVSVIARALVLAGGLLHSVPLMLVFSAAAALSMSPLLGDLNALIAECSEYTFLTSGKRIDGTMFSCTSLGVKIGGGIGTALAGWLLSAGGYIQNAAVQSSSTVTMLYVIYLILPLVLNILITFLLSKLDVEAANQKLRTEQTAKARQDLEYDS